MFTALCTHTRRSSFIVNFDNGRVGVLIDPDPFCLQIVTKINISLTICNVAFEPSVTNYN